MHLLARARCVLFSRASPPWVAFWQGDNRCRFHWEDCATLLAPPSPPQPPSAGPRPRLRGGTAVG
jgi:hypothetical protein